MEYDLIYPEDARAMYDAPCIIAAVYFDEDELKSFGVDKDAYELNDAFVDLNEFEKAFELWNSPLYLSDFYEKHKSFFKQPYWHAITEEVFFKDVSQSITKNKRELIKKMEQNEFFSLVSPLDENIEVGKRLVDSIRVKIKQGTIGGHHPFRFYAVEIEERKCYLITGSTIKVHKDMRKAPNTEIELQKLNHTLAVLSLKEVNTKESFIDFYKSQDR
jgi:hypothetical protein